jgi:hypothetical protein
VSRTDQERRRAGRAQQVALFRYQLIREAADPALSTPAAGPAGPRAGRPGAPGAVRRAGEHVAGDDRPVDPRLAQRRVRRAGAAGPAGLPADRRRDAGPGRHAETGETRPHRRPGGTDLAGALQLVPLSAHPAAPRPGGWSWPPARTGYRRRCPAGSRRPARTSCGPAMRPTARTSRAARHSCSPSSMITPGR